MLSFKVLNQLSSSSLSKNLFIRYKMSNSIEPLIIKTYKAVVNLRRASDEQIKKILVLLADAVEKNIASLLEANTKDLAKQDANNPKNDRLMLNEQRIFNISNSIRNISKLPNPGGKL